jgi:hypothetical protein
MPKGSDMTLLILNASMSRRIPKPTAALESHRPLFLRRSTSLLDTPGVNECLDAVMWQPSTRRSRSCPLNLYNANRSESCSVTLYTGKNKWEATSYLRAGNGK